MNIERAINRLRGAIKDHDETKVADIALDLLSGFLHDVNRIANNLEDIALALDDRDAKSCECQACNGIAADVS